MDRHISAPVGRETAEELRAGDYVYITGTIYTARDAAHKRMYETLREGGDLPINIERAGDILHGTVSGTGRARSDRQIRQRQAVWINILPNYWISEWGQ